MHLKYMFKYSGEDDDRIKIYISLILKFNILTSKIIKQINIMEMEGSI